MADATPQRQPLDIRPFLELVDQELYGNVSGSINHAGESTTAVLLVFGHDHEEVEGVQLRLSAALLDFIRWQQAEGTGAMTDHWAHELDKIVAQLVEGVERLGQDRAATHAGLHAKAKSEEWKRNAQFETELQHEIEFLEQVKEAIDERIAARQSLVDEQVAKRRAEREQ